MTKGIKYNDPAPLYKQVANDIKKRIKEDKLKKGALVGSHSQLSKKYSVSIITIKKALSELVNEGILYTRVGKGSYVSEKPSKRLDLSKHKTIGCVLRDINHPFFSKIVQGIEERAYELGYNLLLSNSSNKIEKEENQINHFRELGVDGLIIASLSLEYNATAYIQKLHEENFPYIMVSYIHDPDFWYIGSNHELGGYMATEHLIKTGYKSIGYMHMGKRNLLSEVRKNGYYRCLTEYNIPFDSKLIFILSHPDAEINRNRFKLGYEFGKEYINMKKRPEALFFYSDLSALGFEQYIMEKGMKIPDDVAIIGFDNITLSSFAQIPLTTVHQPTDKIGRMSVDIIQKRIDGIDIGNRTILKPSLIIRDSCGAKKRMSIESSVDDI